MKRPDRIPQFTEDPELRELNQNLLAMQDSLLSALFELDLTKRDRFVLRESNQARVEAAFSELLVLDTAAQAIDLFLPRGTADDIGRRVAVVPTSASNAVTVRSVAVKIGSGTTHTPSTGVVTEYEWDGIEWWVA